MPHTIVVADAIQNPFFRSLPIFPRRTLAKQRLVVSLLRCRNSPRAVVQAWSKTPASNHTIPTASGYHVLSHPVRKVETV